MIIRQRIDIHAPASSVWDFVSDPERVKQWNPKLIKFEKISLGPIGLHFRYEAVYEMNRKQNALFCEVVQYDKPFHFKVECREKNMSDPGWQNRRVIEEYFLKEEGLNTKLEQIITIEDPRIPWILILLAKFIMMFGKPVGQTYLARLKRISRSDSLKGFV